MKQLLRISYALYDIGLTDHYKKTVIPLGIFERKLALFCIFK